MLEDDPRLREHVQAGLAGEGFAVDAAGCLADARHLASGTAYDAMVLDLNLPDGDGATLLHAERAAGHSTPILLLTARDAVEDRVAGLDAGADDYLVKPFALAELTARLRALLRRPGRALGRVLVLGGLALDTSSRAVSVHGMPMLLPRHELSLLEALLRAAGRVVTRERLLDALYTLDDLPDANALPVHVHHLRRRLGQAGAAARIVTFRGLGYMIEAAPA